MMNVNIIEGISLKMFLAVIPICTAQRSTIISIKMNESAGTTNEQTQDGTTVKANIQPPVDKNWFT